jgi:hypothetical protein
VNKFVLDEQSEARFTVGGGFLPDDKSQVKGWQEGVLSGQAAFEKGTDWYLKGKGMFPSAGQKPAAGGEPSGASPGSSQAREFEDYFNRMNEARRTKASYSAGNYGVSVPSPMQTKTTLTPKSVEIKYPN